MVIKEAIYKGLPKTRNPECGIKKLQFVNMKIATKVKVTWETVFTAFEKL